MRVQSFGSERRRLCEASVVAVFAVVIAGLPASAAEQYRQGLVGAWYGEDDLTNCKDAVLIESLGQSWSESDDYGTAWSAKWQGLVVAPAGGEVRFSAEAEEDDRVIIQVDGGTWDLGYPRMVQRPDGKVVTIYYFTTEKKKEQHIAATIWDPEGIK